MSNYLSSPAQFIRDQISGNIITDIIVRSDGSCRYEMDDGVYSYLFNPTQMEDLSNQLDRLGFTLRLSDELKNAQWSFNHG